MVYFEKLLEDVNINSSKIDDFIRKHIHLINLYDFDCGVMNEDYQNYAIFKKRLLDEFDIKYYFYNKNLFDLSYGIINGVQSPVMIYKENTNIFKILTLDLCQNEILYEDVDATLFKQLFSLFNLNDPNVKSFYKSMLMKYSKDEINDIYELIS